MTAAQSSNDTTVLGEIANGVYAIAYSDVTGLGYSSYEDLFSGSHSPIAEARDLSNTVGNLLLYGNNLTVSSASGQESVTTGSNTIAITPHTNETITANGSGETLAYASGFGQGTIAGLIETGAGADVIQLNVSMVHYLTPSMTQAQDAAALLGHANQVGANVVVSDTAGDTLTLNAMTTSTLAANASAFKFV